MKQWIGCYQCGSYQEINVDDTPNRMACGHPISESYDLSEQPKLPQKRGQRYKERKNV